MNTVAAQVDERRQETPENIFKRSIFGVPVTLTISLGQVRLSVAEILDLGQDSVIPLSAKIDDPVTLQIGDKIIARGELLEKDDGALAVKIIDILELEQE